MMASVIAARSESAAACAWPLDPGTMPGHQLPLLPM
jgi:hypothetical protein